jgi:uncharacterized repeat protein (TIGR03803 family)
MLARQKASRSSSDFSRRPTVKSLTRFALILLSSLILSNLAAFAQAAQQPNLYPPAISNTVTFTDLYDFTGTTGSNPYSGLIMDAADNLYGTTINGGAYGSGTVFKLDSSGVETVLYSFTGGSDGLWPYAGVIMDAARNLYGTTHSGGASASGTVYKLDSAGVETVLYSFTGGSDGAVPLAGLLMDKGGNLYGTTFGCGEFNEGTVFEVDPLGNETVLYSFTGGSDGLGPYAGSLIADSAGNLYGTTSGGGNGYGVVFKLHKSGRETVLHTFNDTDGWYPESGLVMDAAGNLYGTTTWGGASEYCSLGCGTAFKLDPSGNEIVLHSFTGSNGDGFLPLAGVTLDHTGNLYGTTGYGGVNNGGIAFRLDPSGHETVLYSFSDDALAYSNGDLLLDNAGNLYGTAYWSGANGDGMVFEISGGVAPSTLHSAGK